MELRIPISSDRPEWVGMLELGVSMDTVAPIIRHWQSELKQIKGAEHG